MKFISIIEIVAIISIIGISYNLISEYNKSKERINNVNDIIQGNTINYNNIKTELMPYIEGGYNEMNSLLGEKREGLRIIKVSPNNKERVRISENQYYYHIVNLFKDMRRNNFNQTMNSVKTWCKVVTPRIVEMCDDCINNYVFVDILNIILVIWTGFIIFRNNKME